MLSLHFVPFHIPLHPGLNQELVRHLPNGRLLRFLFYDHVWSKFELKNGLSYDHVWSRILNRSDLPGLLDFQRAEISLSYSMSGASLGYGL